MSRLLIFPVETDDPPLVRVSTREQARMIIASSEAHRRAVREGRSRRPQIDFLDLEPSDASESQQSSANGIWASTEDRQSSRTMAEQTPPLLTSEERAASESTNGRLHRLLRGESV